MDPAPERISFDTVAAAFQRRVPGQGRVRVRDDLLLYYERELSFLRQMGAEFAAKYPKVASRLVLEPDKCEDPHVERLLEAFAFLAAPRPPQDRRRVSGDHGIAAEHSVSALSAADSFHVGRGVPRGSGAGHARNRAETGPRGSVLNSRPVQRRAVQIPHLLRHHVLAGRSDRSGMEDARPSAARD